MKGTARKDFFKTKFCFKTESPKIISLHTRFYTKFKLQHN